MWGWVARGQQAAAEAARGKLDGGLELPIRVEVAIERGLSVAEEASMGEGRGQVGPVLKEVEGWSGDSLKEPLAGDQSCHHREAHKSCRKLGWNNDGAIT